MKARIQQIIITLALICAAVSCAPKAIVVEPLAPAVSRVRETTEATKVVSLQLEKKVEVLHTETVKAGEAIAKATAEADRLRKQGEASEAELEANWLAMQDIKAAQALFEQRTEDAVADAKEQKRLREVSEVKLTELETKVVKNDKGVEDLKVAIVKTGDDAALGKSVKYIVRSVIVLAIIGGIVWLAIRMKFF